MSGLSTTAAYSQTTAGKHPKPASTRLMESGAFRLIAVLQMCSGGWEWFCVCLLMCVPYSPIPLIQVQWVISDAWKRPHSQALCRRTVHHISFRILIAEILLLSTSVCILTPDESAGTTLHHLNHGLSLCRVKSSQTEQRIETWGNW